MEFWGISNKQEKRRGCGPLGPPSLKLLEREKRKPLAVWGRKCGLTKRLYNCTRLEKNIVTKKRKYI